MALFLFVVDFTYYSQLYFDEKYKMSYFFSDLAVLSNWIKLISDNINILTTKKVIANYLEIARKLSFKL